MPIGHSKVKETKLISNVKISVSESNICQGWATHPQMSWLNPRFPLNPKPLHHSSVTDLRRVTLMKLLCHTFSDKVMTMKYSTDP